MKIFINSDFYINQSWIQLKEEKNYLTNFKIILINYNFKLKEKI